MPKLDWLNQLGDWNPQLQRELIGRLKPRNLILAGAISILGQFLLWVSFLMRISDPTTYLTSYKGSFSSDILYCTGFIRDGNRRQCLVDAAGNLIVDWQKWSLDLFLALSIIGIFGLLVAGTYLLIDDLAQEESRGTLNFIRLSPRSPQNILWGKILGVPSLLYVVALLAVPLHLWTGFAAHIPLIRILIFYGVLGMSCLFFYSLSLLFGLISSNVLTGFQAWLGSGVVLIFIFSGMAKPILGNASDWLNIFSPSTIFPYLISSTGIKPNVSFSSLNIEALHWFGLPVGMGLLGVTSLLVFNYGLWAYWSWQALQRRFSNPSKSIFSKQQSYLLVACFEVVAVGFAIISDHYRSSLENPGEYYRLPENFNLLLAYNLVLFLGLIITLTPQRQALLDWARYRKQKPSSRKGLLNSSLLRDLIWGEKSPAIVAIALNGAITSIILVPWIIVTTASSDKLAFLMALVLSLISILVYAATAQLVVFMQTQKQGLWIIGTLITVIILPPLVLTLLSVDSAKAPIWLFTVFAYKAIDNAGVFSIFLALLGQLSLLTLGSWQITRQIKKAGVSESRALFAPPKATNS